MNKDLLAKAVLPPTDIQILSKLIEGLGHLGVVTTLDRLQGEVVIQTTQDCWPDLRDALEAMPIEVRIIDEESRV
ncbi:MAG: DUF4911 domain-containing protein [Peptococcaceae bacterium]|jgi:hypothetical protein|nr:DUF4911 domain-containing protein [Peptococcaceae bacterium]